jgi:hypothetical protein
VPLEPEEIEDHVDDGNLAHQSPYCPLVAHVHAALQPLEARALTLERDDLAVEHGGGRAECGAKPAQLRIPRRDVAAAAALEPRPTSLDVRDRTHAVPLHLERVVVLVTREVLRERREHRFDVLGQRLPVGILGRVHAVDHPVVAVGLEQRVPAPGPIAVERDDHLVVVHLVRLVAPAIPDAHAPAAVLATGDVAFELEVLEGVVLGVHRQVVALRVDWDATRDCPREQHPVVLQAKVPVHAPGVVLLDHEPPARLTVVGAAGGLRRLFEVALLPILVEALAHSTMVARRRGLCVTRARRAAAR